MADALIVQYNHLPQIIGALQVVGMEQVKAAAAAIAAYAANNHPYQNRSGQAASAFYTVTKDSSTYGQGVVGSGDLLPEIDKPPDDQTAYVSNASPHFIYLELGTSRMAAYPSLVPALEAVRQAFTSGGGWEKALAALVATP